MVGWLDGWMGAWLVDWLVDWLVGWFGACARDGAYSAATQSVKVWPDLGARMGEGWLGPRGGQRKHGARGRVAWRSAAAMARC